MSPLALPITYFFVWLITVSILRYSIKKYADEETRPCCYNQKKHGLVLWDVKVAFFLCFFPLWLIEIHDFKHPTHNYAANLFYLIMLGIGTALGESLLGHRMVLIEGVLPQSEKSRHYH